MSNGPNSCQNWTGAKNNKEKNAYGVVCIQIDNKKEVLRAHAISFKYYYPKENVNYSINNMILHSCGNSLCCNPTHLRLGTHRENMADRKLHNLIDKERNQPMKRKLNEKEVIEIRNIYANKQLNMQELADKYGVSYQMISFTIRGVYHKEIGGPITRNKSKPKKEGWSSRKLTVKDRAKIVKEFNKGQTLAALAQKYNVSQMTISRAVEKETDK